MNAVDTSSHNSCGYTFTRGKRKGELCGNLCCSKHPPKQNDTEAAAVTTGTKFLDLDMDCLRRVLAIVASQTTRASMKEDKKSKTALIAMMRLAACNKFLMSMIHDQDETIWGACWAAYEDEMRKQNKLDMLPSDWDTERIARSPSSKLELFPIKRKLVLYTMIGCQLCGIPRIRKVHPEFAVRCCKSCLYAHTISNLTLKKEHGIHAAALAGLPFTEVYFYRFHKGFVVLFYWIAHVEQRIGRALSLAAPPSLR